MTTQRILARRGVGSHRQYRIPALAAVGRTVLCAFDGRPDLDDLPAPIDLLLRRSEDGGETWEPPETVRAETGFAGFGDPSLLVDPAAATVLLFHAAGERAGFFESGDGEDPDDPDLQHCDLSVSRDGGRTWEHRRLTAPLRRTGNAHLVGERIAGLFAASGAGCAVAAGPYAGRLVQPFVLRIGTRIDVACALSDDHGETWRLGRSLGAELNESSVAALPDGSLLLHSRGTPHRFAAVSSDGGESFGPVHAVTDLRDPSVNGSVLAMMNEGGRAVLLASHCDDPALRRNLVVSRSDDDGATWRVVQVLEAGAAAYSQLATLPDGRIGVAYEADGYQEIRFEIIGLDSPAAGARAAPAGAPGWSRTASRDGLEIDLVLRSVTPARPERWVEDGPTHTIDLSPYAEIDAAVFKEIGEDRAEDATQVLRTRDALAANLGPITPGLRAGDLLEVHARLRNRSGREQAVAWGGAERVLPVEASWVRRDLTHRITADDLAAGAARVTTAVAVDGAEAVAALHMPTSGYADVD